MAEDSTLSSASLSTPRNHVEVECNQKTDVHKHRHVTLSADHARSAWLTVSEHRRASVWVKQPHWEVRRCVSRDYGRLLNLHRWQRLVCFEFMTHRVHFSKNGLGRSYRRNSCQTIISDSSHAFLVRSSWRRVLLVGLLMITRQHCTE